MDMSAADLFHTYDLTAKLVEPYPELARDFAALQKQFEDKRSQPDASIMVYGVYNAGKSTLINALIGQRVARTGDIPLTDSVDAYRWHNSIILDTPGVDAPVKHEAVTREQMLKADAVIFVVNPSGAAEEEKTLQVLVGIVQAKKKLFLVLNDKDRMDVETLTRLKNDIRIRLQTLADAQGLTEVLQAIPILRVNAEMALQAKLDNSAGLLRVSEFPVFEAALEEFVASIDNQHIYRRLGGELHAFLQRVLQMLDKNTTSATVRSVDTLLKNIVEQQHLCRKTITDEIKRQRDVMYQGSKAALRQDPQQAQGKIDTLFKQACAQIEEVQKQETTFLVQRFADDVDSLQATILSQASSGTAQNIPHMPDMQATTNDQPPEKGGISVEMVNHAVNSLGSIAKPEHIVTGLGVVKDWLPSLMKGIGPKTMEKWGTMVVGKWIPYVGPAITVISSLWGIFAEDRESKNAREQSEQYRREWERYQQEIEDFANTTATQFEANVTRMVNEDLNLLFNAILDKVKASREVASQQDKVLSDNVMEAQRLASLLRHIA